MPKKNIFAFIVLTVLFIAIWWWARTEWMAAQKAEIAQKNEKKDGDKPKDERKDEPKKAQSAPAKAEEQAKAPDPVKSKDAVQPKDEPKNKAPAARPTVEEDIQLGTADSEYYISAKLTTLGGGVQSLTLPKFEKADENGQPVYFPDGKPMPLELIQNDPYLPSFLMMDYLDPTSTNEKWDVSPLLGQSVWKKEEASVTDKLSLVRFSCDQIPGLRIVKTYTLKPREYHIGLSVEIQCLPDAKGKRLFRYQLTGAHGTPIEGDWYATVYRSPMIGYVDERGRLWRDLSDTQARISFKEGGEKVDPRPNWMQYAGGATQYFSSLIVVHDQQANGIKPNDVLEYCRPTWESQEMAGIVERLDWTDPKRPLLIIRAKEALHATVSFVLLPRTAVQFKQRGLKEGDQIMVSWYEPEIGPPERVATFVRPGTVRRPQLDDITVRVVSHALELQPGKTVVHQYVLYQGPSKVRQLATFRGDKAVDEALVDWYADNLHLRTLTDYHSPGWFGEMSSRLGWTDLLILTTRFMHWLLDKLHMLVPNYGLTIMLLTLLVRGSMFPVSRKSALLSQRMQALAPEMKKIQEKYKDDPKAKSAEMWQLYKKHGVSPFGSCLPMLLQMPFFLGLYYCLQESIHFRLAGFLWMDNLAAPDMLWGWGSSIPIISDPDYYSGSFFSFLYLGPYFNVLPVIAVTLMLFQQKMMTPPPADEQQEMQQKMMKYMFVFMGIMFYKVAAGLCIYFIVSSLWGLCERKLLPKRKPVTALAPAAASVGNGVIGGGKPGRGKSKPDKKEKKPEGAFQKVKDLWNELLRQAEKK